MHIADSLPAIPWQRLTTAYGRGTNVPVLLARGDYAALQNLVEHQSTLWQVTPWVIAELLAILRRQPAAICSNMLYLLQAVASACADYAAEYEQYAADATLADMNDLLADDRLWPVDESDDEILWEGDDDGMPHGYDAAAFAGYYLYSARQLLDAVPLLQNLADRRADLAAMIADLLDTLSRCTIPDSRTL